jgi:hypothetical protein
MATIEKFADSFKSVTVRPATAQRAGAAGR